MTDLEQAACDYVKAHRNEELFRRCAYPKPHSSVTHPGTRKVYHKVFKPALERAGERLFALVDAQGQEGDDG